MRWLLASVLVGSPAAFAQDTPSPAASQPPAAAAVAAQSGVDFEHQVAPILLRHCVECHGPKEQKGHLRLDKKVGLFPADKQDDWSVVPGKPDDSDLIHRIGLPADNDDVMPAKGELLTAPQQQILHQWVAEGAVWPDNGDDILAKALAAQVLPKITFDLPAIDADTQAKIDAGIEVLKQRGAVVQPVAADTKALDVNLSLLRDQIGDADLELLQPLAPVLVWLNLSRTAITDAGAEQLAKLTQLRRLHLANTKLGDVAFRALRPLAQLEYLNAYGTQVSDEALPWLMLMPKLDHLYLWDSKVTPDGARITRDHLLRMQVDVGDYVEQRMAAAEKEIAEREAKNQPVNDICPVLDKPVDAAQFVDHEGQRIAFCCAKCKAAFQKDPATYLAKLKLREPAK